MRQNIGLRAHSIGHTAAFYPGNYELYIRIVETDHRRTVERNLVHEICKASNNVIHHLVRLHVLLIDVRYYCDRRLKHQELAVAFVSLRYEPLRSAEPGIR